MKKLKFFNVKLEIVNKEVPILGESIDKLKGKNILFDLTNYLKGKMAEAKFKVYTNNNSLYGKIVYYGLIQNYVRRLVRKGTSVVEDSFMVNSKDKIPIRVKSILVTRKKVVRGVRKKLRNKMRELLIDFVEKNKKDEVFDSIIHYKIQKKFLVKLKKIYPLSICDIRRIEVKK